MPVEPGSNDIPQQIEYLWGLKTSITCSDTVAIIVSLLETPLENLERSVNSGINFGFGILKAVVSFPNNMFIPDEVIVT